MNLWTQLRRTVSAQTRKGWKWDRKNLIVGKFVERLKMLVFQRKQVLEKQKMFFYVSPSVACYLSPSETGSQISRVASQCQCGMSYFPTVMSAKIQRMFMPFNQKKKNMGERK